MWIVFDTTKDGFRTVLKDWQEMALRHVWTVGKPVKSVDVWVHINRKFEGSRSISRASVINFLQAMAGEGVLLEEHRSGKGGYHGIYAPKLDEEGFKRHVAREVVSKLLKTWPDETRHVLDTVEVE